MGFAGNLRTLQLAEVVQTLNRIQATGVLRIARQGAPREVVFNRGEIIGVSLPDGAESRSLLRRLLVEGRIDAQAAAQISSTGRDTQIVESLVERGLAKTEDVEDARRRQAEDELFDIATADSGDFVFHDAGPDSPEATAQVERCSRRPLRIVISAMLMEAARRQDDFERCVQAIPDERTIFGPATGGENRLRQFSDEYPANAVVPLIDAIRNIEEIVRDSVATRCDVYLVLSELVQKEFIVALSIDADAIAPGAAVFAGGQAAGRITSAAFSPHLRRVVAFADIAGGAVAKPLEIATFDGPGRHSATLLQTPERAAAEAYRARLAPPTEKQGWRVV